MRPPRCAYRAISGRIGRWREESGRGGEAAGRAPAVLDLLTTCGMSGAVPAVYFSPLLEECIERLLTEPVVSFGGIVSLPGGEPAEELGRWEERGAIYAGTAPRAKKSNARNRPVKSAADVPALQSVVFEICDQPYWNPAIDLPLNRGTAGGVVGCFCSRNARRRCGASAPQSGGAAC